MGYIEGQDRYQINLLPECIDDYISDDNPVRVIDEYIKQLDLEKLGFKRAVPSSTGRPPYNPRDLLKLYLYGYLNQIRSSRRLERETKRNLEVMWLLNKLSPDFKTIADFRKDNKKALKAVFRDFTKLCDEWNLFGKELVAVDSTKFRASNSKRKNYNVKKLDRHIKYIDEKIDSYIKQLEKNDADEENVNPLSTEEIQSKIQELKERKKQYEELEKDLQKSGQNEISTTDPDARLMSNGNQNSVYPSYNVQTTVDAEYKLIVDFKVTQNPNDLGELDNMALRAKKLFGGQGFELLADKGYYRAQDLKKCVENGIIPYVSNQTHSNGTGDKNFYSDKFRYDKDKNVYICPLGKELPYYRIRRQNGKIIGYEYRDYKVCADCQFKTQCTKNAKGRSIFRHVDQDFLDTINLKTEQNKDKYKLRQMIVEHPFGTIKRGWGADYFLTRRKISVTAEIALSYLSYNFRRVISILGIEEMLKRLRNRRNPVLV